MPEFKFYVYLNNAGFRGITFFYSREEDKNGARRAKFRRDYFAAYDIGAKYYTKEAAENHVAALPDNVRPFVEVREIIPWVDKKK